MFYKLKEKSYMNRKETYIMIIISKKDALTSADRYNAVCDFIGSHTYPSQNTMLDNSWRIFNYYNELGSGGHEGYLTWTAGPIHETEIQSFYDALIHTLQEIGATRLAELETTYGLLLWHKYHALEKGKIEEDEFYNIVQLADKAYLDYEDTFINQMRAYAEKLFPKLFTIVD